VAAVGLAAAAEEEEEATGLAEATSADAEEGGTGMTEDEATCLATAETTKRLAAEAGAAAVGTSTGPAGRAAGTRGRRREEAVEAALSSTSRSRR
jgi:hypothetical protein